MGKTKKKARNNLTNLEKFRLKDKRLRNSLREKYTDANNDWVNNSNQCNAILKNKDSTCNIFTNKFDNQNMKIPVSHSRFLNSIKNRNRRNCQDYDRCRKMLGHTLSGSEPDYNPEKWSNPVIQNSHNCYAYFLDDVSVAIKESCRQHCNETPDEECNCSFMKPQPGSCDKMLYNSVYTCDEMINKIIVDNPHIHLITSKYPEAVKCPKNYYRGAMVVDHNNTYHFYRQDSNGSWSHKQGTLPIERIDSNSELIWNLQEAAKDYNSIVYGQTPCAYFFIPKNSYLDTRICD